MGLYFTVTEPASNIWYTTSMESLNSKMPQERINVDEDNYRRIAHEICTKHADEIYEAQTAFPPLSELGAKLALLSPDVLKNVWGHGILRGTREQ